MCYSVYMTGYITNILTQTTSNSNFRTVLYTAQHMQLVVMSLKPMEDIGLEVHPSVDQFIRIEKGTGKAVLNGEETDITDDSVVVIPAGTQHNIINMSQTEEMKLYTVYTPPQHAKGTIHITKADAEKSEHS